MGASRDAHGVIGVICGDIQVRVGMYLGVLWGVGVCAGVCACVCVCVCVGVRGCGCGCVWVYVCTCVVMCSDVLGYVGMSGNLWGCAGTCRDG